MAKRKPNNNKSTHYVDKQELLNEIKVCQANNKVSETLANMFIQIVDGVSHKFGNLRYYGIEEDVKQDCLLLLLQKYQNFDTTKKTSCFAYLTTIVYHQIQYKLSKNRKYVKRLETISDRVQRYINKD